MTTTWWTDAEGQEGRGRCKNPEKEAAAPCAPNYPFPLSRSLSLSPSCFLSRILSFDSMPRLLLPLFNKRQRYAFRNIPVCTEGSLPQLLRYIPCPNNCIKSMIPDSLKFWIQIFRATVYICKDRVNSKIARSIKIEQNVLATGTA